MSRAHFQKTKAMPRACASIRRRWSCPQLSCNNLLQADAAPLAAHIIRSLEQEGASVQPCEAEHGQHQHPSHLPAQTLPCTFICSLAASGQQFDWRVQAAQLHERASLWRPRHHRLTRQASLLVRAAAAQKFFVLSLTLLWLQV